MKIVIEDLEFSSILASISCANEDLSKKLLEIIPEVINNGGTFNYADDDGSLFLLAIGHYCPSKLGEVKIPSIIFDSCDVLRSVPQGVTEIGFRGKIPPQIEGVDLSGIERVYLFDIKEYPEWFLNLDELSSIIFESCDVLRFVPKGIDEIGFRGKIPSQIEGVDFSGIGRVYLYHIKEYPEWFLDLDDIEILVDDNCVAPNVWPSKWDVSPID